MIAWFGNFSSATQEYDIVMSLIDHLVFYVISQLKRRGIFLIVNIDDIIITSNESIGIGKLKDYLHQHFQTKDLVTLSTLV